MTTPDTQAGGPSMSRPAVELVPGKLFVLGDSIELDGRITWVPPDARGWQPINTYLLTEGLLTEGASALVIDPGVYVHRHVVRRQLEERVPAGSPLGIFLTRAEPDATGNIGEIASRYPVTKLFAGGGPNPFDAFEAAGLMDPKNRGERIQMERMPQGYEVPVGGVRGVEVLRPIIRLLATYWGYDRQTETLFTSDSFSHVIQDSPDAPRVTSGGAAQHAGTGAVRAHLLAKFGWLAHAKTQSIVENLRAMRRGRSINRIAPGRGVVIEGRDAVEWHLDAVETVLKELAS